MISFRTVTRKELYDLVWSKPLRDVAKEFGISDVGLGKTCARHGIPKPPRGYWAQLQAGQKVEKQPLSRSAEANGKTIQIYSTASRVAESAQKVLADAKNSAPEVATSPAPFPVIELHKSIKLTALTLRKSKASKDGLVRAIDEGMHGIVVSPDQVERAVFVLDGLARRLESAELVFGPTGKAMRVALGQDHLTFTLTEKTRRQKHIPTAEELKAEEQKRKRDQNRWRRSDPWANVDLSPYERPYPEWDIIKSGELVVQIEGYGGQGLRKSWSDGRRQKIELLLDDVVVGIRAFLAAEKHQREEREAWAREQEHLRRRREKAKQRQEREMQRLAFFKRMSDAQVEIARIEGWLEAFPGTGEEAALERMKAWAQVRLAELKAALDSTGLEAGLQKIQLFPETDPLFDPEGEPPANPYSY